MVAADIKVDVRQIVDVSRIYRQFGAKAPPAIMRATNRTGDSAWTQMVRALTGQTGLKRAVIARAIKKRRASAGNGSYVLRSAGGNVSIKYFGARETRKGVSAAPWGGRKVFKGTFIKGGLFPNRVALALNGQVFMRSGKARLPIVKQRSGLFIPTEMVKGSTAAAFLTAFRTVFPVRIAHELARLLSK